MGVSIAHDIAHKPNDPNKQTTVILSLGEAPNSGGSVPHIAAWDAHGNRIGQYKGDANGHLADGQQVSYTFDNYQNNYQPARPEYISVVMQETDGICLSMITAEGDSMQ